MCHCQRRGAQLFLGQDSHLHLYEHGGAAQVRAAAVAVALVALVTLVTLVAVHAGQEGGRVLPSSGCQGRRRIRGHSVAWIIVPNRGLQHEWGLRTPDGGDRGLEPPCTITVPCQLHALPCPGYRSPVCTPRHCQICPTAHST